MNEFAGLFEQRLGNGRVRVTETAHRDAAPQVEKTSTGHVVDVGAGTVAQRELEPRIAWDDVFLKQRLDGGDLVANNGGRRRDYFFHLKLGFGLREPLCEDNEFLLPVV